MQLPLSEKIASHLRVLDEAPSTNDVLADLAKSGGEDYLSVVVTLDQTAGRGRLGRSWVAPPGTMAAVSVLLPAANVARESLGWVPLIAGTAMAASIDELIGGGRTGLKWPNDVQIDGLKVCGVLSELLPSTAVIVGTGINLFLTADELPVATATSLALAGVELRGDELVDAVLSRYLARLDEMLSAFAVSPAGIHRQVAEWCRTLGRNVRVELPGGENLFGVAVGIDENGCLLVRSERDDEVVAVAAGDITHLRYE